MTERRRDPYAILGVPRHASRKQLGRAYRALAKRAHPDVSAQPSARMQELNWAWDLLSDPARRAAWDRTPMGVGSTSHWTAPEPWVRPVPPQWDQPFATPDWTVSGEPWAGPGAPAVERRQGIGCMGLSLLVLAISAFVLYGAFMSGYESPGGEPPLTSEAPAEN